MVFLGILLDGENKCLLVPEEKLLKAQKWLKLLIHKRMAAVNELEKLTGLWNFLNKALVPGQAFTRRMYAKVTGVKYHTWGTRWRKGIPTGSNHITM